MWLIYIATTLLVIKLSSFYDVSWLWIGACFLGAFIWFETIEPLFKIGRHAKNNDTVEAKRKARVRANLGLR
jgi:hypothetical protein